MQGANSADGFVYVPVPTNRWHQVIALLASQPSGTPREAPGAKPARASSGEHAGDGSPLMWSEDSFGELFDDEPKPTQRVVLKYLAENAGRAVTAWELRTALKESGTVTTERDGRALGAIIRALKKRAAWYHREPPFDSWWDHDRAQNCYWMPEEYGAPLLRALRARYPASA